MENNRFLFILFIILLLSAVLRMFNLDAGIDADEGELIALGKLPATELLSAISVGEPHPPLHYFLFHFWLQLGDGEFFIRLLPVIFGVASVFLIYKICLLIFNEEKVSLLAALFAAVSPFLISASQMIRYIPIFIFFIFCSFYFLLKVLRGGEKRDWIYYCFFTILSFYTHYYTIFFIVSSFLIFLVTKKSLKDWFVYHMIIFVFVSPLIPLFIEQQNSIGEFKPMFQEPGIFKYIIVPKIFQQFFWGWAVDLIDVEPVLQINWFGATISILIVMIFFNGVRESKTAELILLITLFTPILLAYFLNLFMAVPMLPHRFAFISFPFFILLAHGVMKIKERVLFSAIIFISVLSLLFSTALYFSAEREQWRDVSDYIRANSNDGDVIGVSSPWASLAFQYYFRGNVETYGIPFDMNLTDRDMERKLYAIKENVEPSIKRIANGKSRLWLIQSREKHYDPDGLVKKYLDENYKLSYTKDYPAMGAIKLSLYELNND